MSLLIWAASIVIGIIGGLYLVTWSLGQMVTNDKFAGCVIWGVILGFATLFVWAVLTVVSHLTWVS